MLDQVKESDINIHDYLIKSEPMNEQDLIQLFGPFFQAAKDSKMLEGKKQNVFMDHLVFNEDGTTSSFRLNLADESKGTENLFLLAPVLMHALSTGETVVIDEIECSLHPLLVKHVASYFNDPERNPNHAQLIFNTHNLELMSLDIFCRDQIYFVDKSVKTGASELYSLDEFSVRAEENIKKGYLFCSVWCDSVDFGGVCPMKRRFGDKLRGTGNRKRNPVMFIFCPITRIIKIRMSMGKGFYKLLQSNS